MPAQPPQALEVRVQVPLLVDQILQPRSHDGMKAGVKSPVPQQPTKDGPRDAKIARLLNQEIPARRQSTIQLLHELPLIRVEDKWAIGRSPTGVFGVEKRVKRPEKALCREREQVQNDGGTRLPGIEHLRPKAHIGLKLTRRRLQVCG